MKKKKRERERGNGRMSREENKHSLRTNCALLVFEFRNDRLDLSERSEWDQREAASVETMVCPKNDS